MALIVTIQNDGTGTDAAANYTVKVFVQLRQIDQVSVTGHPRKESWRALLTRLLAQNPETEASGSAFADSSAFNDAARQTCHEFGLAWTDPQTGRVYPPPPKKGRR